MTKIIILYWNKNKYGFMCYDMIMKKMILLVKIFLEIYENKICNRFRILDCHDFFFFFWK